MRSVVISKVVSKNFVTDFWASFLNLVGKNLTPYEEMVSRGVSQIEDEIKIKGYRLKWYRYEITQLTNGSLVIMLYGDVFGGLK